MDDPTPKDYTPRLAPWGHVWRLLIVALISAMAWSTVVQGQWQHHRWLFYLDAGLGAISFVLVFFRRRYPLQVAIALNVLNLGSAISAGPATLASVSLATRRVLWQIVLVGVISVVSGQGFNDLQPSQNERWWVTLTFTVAVTAAMLAIGMYIGSRRELLWTLRERARQAEDEHGLRVEAARAAERERIAREMHDVLAHRISMVSMHAGALAYRTDLPPEQVRETAELIQTKAHEALTDLRQVLGVLRNDEPALHDRPQPTMRDLPSLVHEARDAGMHVDLDIEVDGEDDVPEQVARTVYRIVQEGLTNARKHALGTAVRFRIEGAAGPGVDVWVRNPDRVGGRTTTPGAGLGLVGLRERAELAGGRLDVSRERDNFALHGWLPWPA
ncbi:MAG: histidine kinase [Actinomycetota bacterium]|nr:histidine kinase [Actinomycetota bacterium]